MTDVDTGPAPLRLPAILQNPVNKAQRQIEAHNAQQREKAAARREAARAPEEEIISKRGKRVVRRMNNAAHIDNPHAVRPSRKDQVPSVPLHYHPLRPSFPAESVERNTPIPSLAQRADPLSSSSAHGAFTTSLKGTRAMLRRRGRRAESIVPTVEDAVRGWLGGEFETPPSDRQGGWHTIDATRVDLPRRDQGEGQNGGPSRRMPPQHQVNDIPELPVVKDQVAAVLELSRSPAHLSWAVPDSFDRLVVHLVARYYELISWSEDQQTTTGQTVRLTHILRPNVAKAKAPPPSHALLTPETSDASGISGSDTEHGSTTEGETDPSSDSDAATEMGHSDTESVNEEADTTATPSEPRSLSERWADDTDSEGEGSRAESPHPSLTERFGALDLHRTASHESHHSHGSSAYASSEGGWTDVGADSTVFHRPGGWEMDSPVHGTTALPRVGLKGGAPLRLGGDGPLDKPSFFEYLFGE